MQTRQAARSAKAVHTAGVASLLIIVSGLVLLGLACMKCVAILASYMYVIEEVYAREDTAELDVRSCLPQRTKLDDLL